MNEHELDRLSDDELVKRAVAAREAGDFGEVRQILAVLTMRRLPNVIARVRLKVPEADVEDVAMEAVASAIKASFDGSSVGEFVVLLNTIVSRRIADYHRSRPEAAQALPEEHEGDDDYWGHVLGGGDPADWLLDTIDANQAIRQALGELSDPHRGVIELFVFSGWDADETAEETNKIHGDTLATPMSTTNVHKIASRFRKRVRKLLEEADPSG